MKKILLIMTLFCFASIVPAVEFKTIDNTNNGDFLTISEAVDYLNNLTALPEGGIVFNILAGQVFTEVPDTITTSGTSTEPVVFRKFGEEVNPVLQNSSTATEMIHLFNANYITFDGLDITDSNTADSLRYATAYYLNSSENIIIENCNISNFNEYGIYSRYESANISLENNQIFYTDDYSTDQTTVYGIYAAFNASADNVNVLSNRIWGLKYASAIVYGIRIAQVNSTVANNFVSFTADNNDKIYGIRLDGRDDKTFYAYYNTVVLHGVATDEGFGLYTSGGTSTTTFNIFNNIFINNRNNGNSYGTGISFAAPVFHMDYNLFYAANQAGFLLNKFGTVDYSTIEGWQAACGEDSASVVTDVEFIDTFNGDLHLTGSSLGSMDLAGMPLINFSTDIDGEIRAAEFPYKGADENTEYPICEEIQSEYVIDNLGAGDFMSFNEAIDFLNSLAEIPSGGLTFNVSAGQEFTENPDTITAIGSETSAVIFRKSGEGNNPVIKDSSAEVSIIEFNNAAYITFDGIDITDTNPADENKYAIAYYLYASQYISIINCNISDFAEAGISVANASQNTTFENNSIYHSEAFFSGASTAYGIKISYNANAENALVSRNKIFGLKGATGNLYGIEYNQVTGSIINNFVSITDDNNDKVYGMRITGRDGRSINAYHNTVFLAGTATDAGYAVGVLGGAGTVNVKNNVFINNRPDSTQYVAHIGIIYPGMLLDNNIYYCEFRDGFNAQFGGGANVTYVTDFEQWQTLTGFESNSLVYETQFIDAEAGDLHIAGSSLGNMSLKGEANLVASDIDNETRSVTNPYCGADENQEHPLQYSLFIIATSLSFGSIPVGEESEQQSFMIVNSSDSSLVENISVSTDFYFSLDGTNWVQTISDLEVVTDSLEIFVKFIPQTMMTYEGTISIISQDMESGQHSITLSGTGTAAEISLSAASLDFASVLVNSLSVPQAITITNSGNSDLEISTITIGNNFSVKLAETENWSQLLEGILITAMNSQVIEVRFEPAEPVAYLENLTINSSDADEEVLLVELTGIGVLLSPPLNLTADSGDAQVVLNWDEPVRSATTQSRIRHDLRNRELESYNIYRETITNRTRNSHRQSSRELLANTTSLMYTDNAVTNGSTYQYYVTAVYINPDQESAPSNVVVATPMHYEQDINIGETELDFGRVIVGQISEPLNLIIENTGNFTLSVNQITIAQPFAIKTSEDEYINTLAAFDINPQESGTIQLVYLPSEFVDNQIQFVISSDDPDESQITLTLSGRGIGVSFTDIEAGFSGVYHSSSSWGDYDNDGDLDLLYSGYGTIAPAGEGELYLYRNEGNDFFSYVDPGIPGVGAGMLNWVDLDSDGDLDIFISGQRQLDFYTVKTYLNNNGTFTELENPELIPLKTGSSEWKDYDFDGDFDLLICGAESIPDQDDINHLDIYLNNGSGYMSLLETSLTSVSDGAAAWGDYDNDGDYDVVLAGSHDSNDYITQIFRLDENGYVNINADLLGLRYSDVSWGDYDSDGDLDILLTGSFVNESPSELKIYRNDGNDTFIAVNHTMIGVRQGDADWGDFDNDGDYDVIINGIYSNSFWAGYIYIQENPGYFVLADSIISLKYSDISLMDYDNDEDLDFCLIGRYDYMWYEARIFRNDMTYPNTAPFAPSDLQYQLAENSVTLSWDMGSDAQTPAIGLSYNLRVGTTPGGEDVYSGMVDADDGFRRLTGLGNVQLNRVITLNDLQGSTYYWSVQSVDNSQATSLFAAEVNFEIVGIQDGNSSVYETALTGNYPNPFNPVTNISFTIGDDNQKTSLIIYNILGQKVKTLVNSLLEKGAYNLSWNGTDDDNKRVASGIFFYRLTNGKDALTRKMILIK